MCLPSELNVERVARGRRRLGLGRRLQLWLIAGGWCRRRRRERPSLGANGVDDAIEQIGVGGRRVHVGI